MPVKTKLLANEDSKKNLDLLRRFKERCAQNKRCINCLHSVADHACLDFGSFVCKACSEAHCEFGHKAGAIDMMDWTDEALRQMRQGGNRRAEREHLANWEEAFFPRPKNTDSDGLQNFIRKAYVIKCWQRQPKAGGPRHYVWKRPLDAKEAGATGDPTDEDGLGEQAEGVDEQTGCGGENAASDTAQTPAAPLFVSLPTSEASFCSKHDVSEKRPKQANTRKTCLGCKIEICTTYCQFAFCPACSKTLKNCMICGDDTERTEVLEQRSSSLCESGRAFSETSAEGIQTPTSVGDADVCTADTSSEDDETAAKRQSAGDGASQQLSNANLFDMGTGLVVVPTRVETTLPKSCMNSTSRPVANTDLLGDLLGLDFCPAESAAPSLPAAQAPTAVAAPAPAGHKALVDVPWSADFFDFSTAAPAAAVLATPITAAAQPVAREDLLCSSFPDLGVAPLSVANAPVVPAAGYAVVAAPTVAATVQKPPPAALPGRPEANHLYSIPSPAVVAASASLFDSRDSAKDSDLFGDLLSSMQSKDDDWFAGKTSFHI
eukprot:TRINITY_DN126000_c0_g1_i1.p1 TRINITY_DN126000_c0_g1~~TRINITY_DN126000_c0_g1_i1.p1  ORF type:complete len:548 (+),score=135.95 TRINITY_DN126000_c0_g1_i1:100-1743(+)